MRGCQTKLISLAVIKENSPSWAACYLQKILTIIIRTTDPNRVVLYGSRSRGDYNPTSDIDLAVSSEDMHGVQDQLNEEAPTLLKIDLINLNKTKGSLKEEIEREGILLYENCQT